MTMMMIGVVACTRPPAGVDDEASGTTKLGEESSEESTDESPTTSTDTMTVFVPPDDMPPGPPSCDSFAQDCPPGEKCVPYASNGNKYWDDHKCVPVLGDQPPGEPCKWDGLVEATDDCDASSACWDAMEIDGELIGQCLAFCEGTVDNPQCPEATYCFGADYIPGLCIPQCDPLLQDCGPGLGCFWVNLAFDCIFTAGEIPTGDPCGYINDCAPGNVCTSADSLPACAGEACCTNFCDLDLGDVQCGEPGTACVPFFEDLPAPAGFEDVGFCVLPPP